MDDPGRRRRQVDVQDVGPGSRRPVRDDAERQEHRDGQEHPRGRGLGLFRPVEHADGGSKRRQCGAGDRGGHIPQDAAVLRRAQGRRDPAGELHGQMGRMQPRDGGRLLRRGVLLRPRTAQGTECPRRPDSHLLGRHARGIVDQPGDARGRPGLRAHRRSLQGGGGQLPDGQKGIRREAGAMEEGCREGQGRGDQGAAETIGASRSRQVPGPRRVSTTP